MNNDRKLITKNLWGKKIRAYWVSLTYSSLPGTIGSTYKDEGLHECAESHFPESLG